MSQCLLPDLKSAVYDDDNHRVFCWNLEHTDIISSVVNFNVPTAVPNKVVTSFIKANRQDRTPSQYDEESF
jgi:hypothetical protein